MIVSNKAGTYANLYAAHKYGGGEIRGCQQLTSGEPPRCVFRPRTGFSLDSVRGEVLIQVFEGTKGIDVSDSTVRFLGRPLRLGVSPEIVGRVFSGLGELSRDEVNGANRQVSRRRYIQEMTFRIEFGKSSIRE